MYNSTECEYSIKQYNAVHMCWWLLGDTAVTGGYCLPWLVWEQHSAVHDSLPAQRRTLIVTTHPNSSTLTSTTPPGVTQCTQPSSTNSASHHSTAQHATALRTLR